MVEEKGKKSIDGKDFLWNLYTSFASKNKIWYFALLLTMLGIPIHRLIIPSYYGNITGQIQKRALNQAQSTLLIILGFWVIVTCLDIAKGYIIATLWPRFSSYCREKMLRVILSKYSKNYEAVKTGLIQAKINDIPWVLDSTFNLVQKILIETVTLVISTFIYLWYLDIKLVGVFAIGIAVLGIVSSKYINNTVQYVHHTEMVYEDYFEEISEVLGNLINIFTNNQEEYNIQKLQDTIASADLDYKKIRDTNVKYKLIYYSVSLSLFMGLLLVGLSLYKSGKMTSSELVGLFIVSYTLLGSIMLFYYNSKDIIENNGTIEVINTWFNDMPIDKDEDMLNIATNINSDSAANNVAKYIGGINDNLDIVIDKLWFRYCNGASGGHGGRCTDSEDKWLYHGLSLQLNEGQHTVVTGHIGSGKSTFAKLIIRLYSLDEENGRGRILLGGRDIMEWDTKAIRKLVSYTPQKTALFNDTLWNNIKYGLSNSSKYRTVTPKIVLDTLRRAGLVAVADKFAGLMHKSVGKLGSRLSGGQQQIIWLLRALFNDSRWILMDEPTNNLDPESIEYVKRLIKEIQSEHGKTTVIITHDKALLDLGKRHIKFMNGDIASDTPI